MASSISCFIELVRDHIPLQQGLRRLSCLEISLIAKVRDHIPLQQGLRHCIHAIRGLGNV